MAVDSPPTTDDVPPPSAGAENPISAENSSNGTSTNSHAESSAAAAPTGTDPNNKADAPEIAATTDASNSEDRLSANVTLADLCAKGTALYARKQYEAASEAFSAAANMQAELNGDMNPQNAEILFLYGRSLFRIGQSKSDVLGGGSVVADKSNSQQGKQTAVTEKATGQQNGSKVEETSVVGSSKPLFSFEGDEELEASGEADADEDSEEVEDEAEEDDLETAFTILELARVLFKQRLDQASSDEATSDAEGKGKEVVVADLPTTTFSPILRHINERLGDTHDLLAEISLENERYPEAITDFRDAVRYKTLLYPADSEIIAEAHYKLSLALEFASVTTLAEEAEESGAVKQVDQSLRDEAAVCLQAAIDSTAAKLRTKEAELADLTAPEDRDPVQSQITEVKEIMKEMEQRLTDLRGPPIDVQAALGLKGNAKGGLLQETSDQSPAAAQARIEDAKKNATDVMGLVRKKAKSPAPLAAADADANAPAVPPAPASEAGSVGTKRKLEENTDADAAEPALATEVLPKRAKVDQAVGLEA